MAQINMHTTPEFEVELAALMRARGIPTKSEAIRVAVREAAVRARPGKRDLRTLRGLLNRLPGERLSDKSSAELLAELDAEMNEKLDRLSR
jgi:Arc/MetJ-type ribon-helix-helix transcriptional regulator